MVPCPNISDMKTPIGCEHRSFRRRCGCARNDEFEPTKYNFLIFKYLLSTKNNNTSNKKKKACTYHRYCSVLAGRYKNNSISN